MEFADIEGMRARFESCITNTRAAQKMRKPSRLRQLDLREMWARAREPAVAAKGAAGATDETDATEPLVKYLFFDTETNGMGGFRETTAPDSLDRAQTLMQLAWEVTDADGNVLSSRETLVKGAKYVNPKVPHDITVTKVARAPSALSAVLDFVRDAEEVTRLGGKLVAHNISFDMYVLKAAARTCPDLARRTQLLFNPQGNTYCTMAATKLFCGAKNKRGSLKSPRLEELYAKLFGKAPNCQLHDALNDVRVLRECFFGFHRRRIF